MIHHNRRSLLTAIPAHRVMNILNRVCGIDFVFTNKHAIKRHYNVCNVMSAPTTVDIDPIVLEDIKKLRMQKRSEGNAAYIGMSGTLHLERT